MVRQGSRRLRRLPRRDVASPRDRVMIQVAAQLLITPILEHLSTVAASGCNTGTEPTTRTHNRLIDGQTASRPVSSNESLNHLMHHYRRRHSRWGRGALGLPGAFAESAEMNADFVDKDITFGPECGGPVKPPLDRTQRPRQSVNCQIHSETWPTSPRPDNEG